MVASLHTMQYLNFFVVSIMISHEPKSLMLNRHPEVRELFPAFQDMIRENQRPADQVVLSDEDVMRILKISKRTLITMREERNAVPVFPIRRSRLCT